MTANVDAMVREGIRAYKAGKKSEARALLEKAVELDQYNEQGWMWLSAVVDTPEEQRTCLENVLFINPDNQNAKQGLQYLTTKTGGAASTAPAAPPRQEDDAFANVSFSPPSPAFSEPPKPSQQTPFMPDREEDDDWVAPPTATSSASSVFRPQKETSSAEYDNWVAGLNLGSKKEEADEEAASSIGTVPFADPNEIFGANFFDDEIDDDNLEPAGNRFAGSKPDNRTVAEDPFDDDEMFTSGPFSATTFEVPEVSAPPTTSPPSRKTAPVLSPAREGTKKPSKGGDDDLLSGGLFVPEDDSDSAAIDEPEDPSEYFHRIPKEISATRLPGTIESLSPLLVVGMVILVMLNLGAVIWLFSTLAG